MRKHGSLHPAFQPPARGRGQGKGRGRGRGRGKRGRGGSRSSPSALPTNAYEAQGIRLGFAAEETTPYEAELEAAADQDKDPWVLCDRCGAWRMVVTDAAREAYSSKDSSFFCEMQPPDDCAVNVDERWLFEPSFPKASQLTAKGLDLPKCLLCLEQLVFRVPSCGLRGSKVGSNEEQHTSLVEMVQRCKGQVQTVKDVSGLMKHIYQQIKKPFLHYDWSQSLVEDNVHTTLESNWMKEVDSAQSPKDVYDNGTTLEELGIDWGRLIVVDEFLKVIDSIDDVCLGAQRLDYVRNQVPAKIGNVPAARRNKSLVAGSGGFAAILIEVCEVVMGGKLPQSPLKQEAGMDSSVQSPPRTGMKRGRKRMKVEVEGIEENDVPFSSGDQHWFAGGSSERAKIANDDDGLTDSACDRRDTRGERVSSACDRGHHHALTCTEFSPSGSLLRVKMENDEALASGSPHSQSSKPAQRSPLDADSWVEMHGAGNFGDDGEGIVTMGPAELQAWSRRAERVSKILKTARDLKKGANSERMQVCLTRFGRVSLQQNGTV